MVEDFSVSETGIENPLMLKSFKIQPDVKEKEGQLLRAVGKPEVYWVLDGKARWVLNPKTFNNLFNNWSLV